MNTTFTVGRHRGAMEDASLFRLFLRGTGRLVVWLRYHNPFDMGRYEGYTPFMDDRYLQRHSEADLEGLGGLVWFGVCALAAVLAAGALSAPLDRLLHGP
jgi:hypothetical protein